MKDNNIIISSVISIINFAKEKIKYTVNPNEKFIKYGVDNKYPQRMLEYYNTIPEHNSSIDFIVDNIIGIGLNTTELDFWDVKKIVQDFNIFGGYSVQVIKKRNGGFQLLYVDFSKLRYNLEKTKIGYSEDWCVYKPEIKWYNISADATTDGIFIYKNIKTRELYPQPSYISATMSLDTMDSIMLYHNQNAKNGFTPSVLINYNSGIPDPNTQKAIEEGITNKFTGESGQRFIVSFNKSKDTETTFEKLENDNLDAKFETLQKFIQNQIIVSHKLTSGTLIGIKPENQGFSKTEFDEALEVFKTITINGFRNELEYSFKLLTGKEYKFQDEQKIQLPTQNNQPIGG